jgi:hypothetical protein
MANYEINLTATQIESALNKAHAPATVVDNTQNLVESGAIKTYVDTQVSAGASITTASFAGSALEDSTDGLTATDTAVPTSAAVKNYVDTSVSSATENSTPNNRLIIKVLPSDFHNATDDSDTFIQFNGKQITGPNAWAAVANVDIPQGYKATHFTYTANYSLVYVYENTLADTDAVQKGFLGATGLGTRTINITDVTGTSNNYLSIRIGHSNSLGRYYGGYVTIAKV